MDSNFTISKKVKNSNKEDSSHNTSIDKNVKLEVPVVVLLHHNSNNFLYNTHKFEGSERNENAIALANQSHFAVKLLFLLTNVQILFTR